MCELLCAGGADPNYSRRRPGIPDFPLWVSINQPAVVRVLLRFGADPTRTCRSYYGGDLVTPDEEALRWANKHEAEFPGVAAEYRECAPILAEARILRQGLAGSSFSVRWFIAAERRRPP